MGVREHMPHGSEGFRVWGLEFRVQGFGVREHLTHGSEGFRVWGLEFRFWGLGNTCHIGLEFRV